MLQFFVIVTQILAPGNFFDYVHNILHKVASSKGVEIWIAFILKVLLN